MTKQNNATKGQQFEQLLKFVLCKVHWWEVESFIGMMFGLVSYHELVQCSEPEEKDRDQEMVVPSVYPIKAELAVRGVNGQIDGRAARKKVTLWYPCRAASFPLCDYTLRLLGLHRNSKASEYKQHGHQHWQQASARLRNVFITHMNPLYVLFKRHFDINSEV